MRSESGPENRSWVDEPPSEVEIIREPPSEVEIIGEPLSEVEIIVLHDPRSLRNRIAAASAVTRAAAIAALIVVLGAVAAALIAGSRRGGQPSARTRNALGGNASAGSAPGPAGVAAAYGFPIQCLAVTVATVDPHYARADPNRASPCGRYDGTMMAIFERVGDRWRPVLTTTSYRCPVSALPLAVQNELAVCPSAPGRR
jgi:hypothetical protein